MFLGLIIFKSLRFEPIRTVHIPDGSPLMTRQVKSERPPDSARYNLGPDEVASH